MRNAHALAVWPVQPALAAADVDVGRPTAVAEGVASGGCVWGVTVSSRVCGAVELTCVGREQRHFDSSSEDSGGSSGSEADFSRYERRRQARERSAIQCVWRWLPCACSPPRCCSSV